MLKIILCQHISALFSLFGVFIVHFFIHHRIQPHDNNAFLQWLVFDTLFPMGNRLLFDKLKTRQPSLRSERDCLQRPKSFSISSSLLSSGSFLFVSYHKSLKRFKTFSLVFSSHVHVCCLSWMRLFQRLETFFS